MGRDNFEEIELALVELIQLNEDYASDNKTNKDILNDTSKNIKELTESFAKLKSCAFEHQENIERIINEKEIHALSEDNKNAQFANELEIKKREFAKSYVTFGISLGLYALFGIISLGFEVNGCFTTTAGRNVFSTPFKQIGNLFRH